MTQPTLRPITHADLESQAISLVTALGGRWATGGAMCRCPAHADRTPSLSVRLGRTSLLFKCFAGCRNLDVIRALRRLRLLDGPRLPTAAAPVPRCTHKHGWAQATARKLWHEARCTEGTPAALYLRSRGLAGPHPEVRFHPRTPLGRGAELRHLPAMLTAIRNDAGLVGVQRTFLDPTTGAKALMPTPKMVLGRLSDGAVRLASAGPTLGLAEGMETARSAMLLLRIPVWAALGNERFDQVTIPARVEHLVLLADNDRGGRVAAEKACVAHARPGRRIELLWPDHPHNDWNDQLQASSQPPT